MAKFFSFIFFVCVLCFPFFATRASAICSADHINEGDQVWEFLDYCLIMAADEKTVTAFSKSGKKIWRLSSNFSDPTYGHLYLPRLSALNKEAEKKLIPAMFDMNGNGLPELILSIFTYDTPACCHQYYFFELDGDDIVEIALLETSRSSLSFENFDDDPALEIIIHDGILQESGSGFEPLIPVAIELDGKNKFILRQDMMMTTLSSVEQIKKRDRMTELALFSENGETMLDYPAIQGLYSGLVYNGNIDLAIDISMTAGRQRHEKYGQEKAAEWFKLLCKTHNILKESIYFPLIINEQEPPFCQMKKDGFQWNHESVKAIYKNKIVRPVNLMGGSLHLEKYK